MAGDFVETFLCDGATLERFGEISLDGALLKIVERGFEGGTAAGRDLQRRGEHLVTQTPRDIAGTAIVVLGDNAMALLVFDDACGSGEGCPKGDVQARGDGGGGDARGAGAAESGGTNDAGFHFAREFVNAKTHLRGLERRHVGWRIRRVEGAADDVGRLNLDGHAVGRGERGRAQRQRCNEQDEALQEKAGRWANGQEHV